MARPKKYRTKAELKEANRLKSQRHYERNRETINKRRREKRAKTKAREARKRARREARGGQASTHLRMASDKTTFQQAFEKAHKIYTRFQDSVNGNTVDYLESICLRVLSDFKKGQTVEAVREFLKGHSEALSPFTAQILAQYNKVLQFRGVAREISELEAMLGEIDRVQGWVDDVETHLSIGVDDFVEAYHKKELMFQN